MMEIQPKLEPPDMGFDDLDYLFPTTDIPEITEHKNSNDSSTCSIKSEPDGVPHGHDYVMAGDPKTCKSTQCNMHECCKTVNKLFGENGVVDCVQCGNMFCNIDRMIQHLLKDHQQQERLFHCRNCFEYFPSVEIMTHLYCKQGGLVRKYPTFTDVPKFMNNLLCVFCDAKFPEADELAIHFNREHNKDSSSQTPKASRKKASPKQDSKQDLCIPTSANPDESDGVLMDIQWIRTVHVPKNCSITSS